MKTDQPTEMKLSEDVQAFLQGFSDIFASMAHLSIPEQRKKIQEMFLFPKHLLEPVENVEDKTIKGRHGNIPLRIITPKNCHYNATLVFFHRGGWVYGSNDEAEGLCRKIANHTHAQVVQVEFRLSPENKFPVPLEDCYDAVLWACNHFDNHIVLCGESAGGNLAAAVSMMALNEEGPNISAQVLIYPILTSDLIEERYEQSPDKHLLSYGNMQWFWSQYLSDPSEGNQSLASPLKAANLQGLPKTMIMTAEFDALCLEGKEYAEKLGRAGVPVVYKQYSKVIHGFLDIPVPSKETEKALKDINAFIASL